MGFASIRRRDVLRLAASGAVLVGLGRPAGAQQRLSPQALMGVWRGSVEQGGVRIAGEIIFRLDGTYQRMHWFGQLRTWASGNYRIAGNWIHFEVDDYQPKYYEGVFQQRPPSETWMVGTFDGHTIKGEIGGAARFSYRRQD